MKITGDLPGGAFSSEMLGSGDPASSVEQGSATTLERVASDGAFWVSSAGGPVAPTDFGFINPSSFTGFQKGCCSNPDLLFLLSRIPAASISPYDFMRMKS